MKTYILEWNPAVSPMTEDDFRGAISNLEWGDFRIGLPEMPSARSGDNFYILRVGTDSDGLVGKGFFLSVPYEPQNNNSFIYINARPTFLVSWEHPKGILSLDELSSSLDSIQWGNSGRCIELSRTEAATLSSLWEEFSSRFTEEDFRGSMSTGLLARSERPDAILDDALLAAADALYDLTDRQGNPLILKALELASSWQTPRYKTLSFLFYAVQYSELDEGAVREKGFPEEVADSVSAMKRSPEMGMRDYLRQLIHQNNLRASKIAVRDMELHHDAWPVEDEEQTELLDALYESAGWERER